jgi:Zn-dependent protease
VLRSWKLGRVFDIDLYLHSTFLLLPAWALFVNRGGGLTGAVFALLFLVGVFGCVVLHELGHALAARRFGIGTRDITLYPIGGVARLERMSERPGEELAIALAGPAVNVVLAGLLSLVVVPALLSGALRGLGGVVSLSHGPLALGLTFLFYLWLANIFMVVFNLLPAFPMDGGRVLRALLSMGFGHLRATEIASIVGLIMAAVIGALSYWFGNPMLLVIAVFVCLAGQQEVMILRRRARQPAPILDALPADAPGPAPAAGPVGPGFTGFTWDRDYHVWVMWHNGRPVGAYGRGME